MGRVLGPMPLNRMSNVSYRLFDIPRGYRTDFVLIIAPYFDPIFITQLIDRLAPSRIRLLVDDGARAEDLLAIRKCCGRKTDLKIALGAARGLVHLKGFYIEFVKAEGRERRMRRFFYGSTNATDAAFRGSQNAELLAAVDLMAGEDTTLISHLNGLVSAVESGTGHVKAATFGPLRNSPHLYLPSFRIVSPGPPPGFDAWLQRGRLAAKFREAAQFLHVSVRLKKPLPQAAITRTFSRNNLVAAGRGNVVRYAYLGRPSSTVVTDADDSDQEPQWKAHYCNWTHLGDWLSDDCYNHIGDKMVPRSGETRRVVVEDLLQNGRNSAWRTDHAKNFLQALRDSWSAIATDGEDPGSFLEGDDTGINESSYEERFADKLESDYLLAQNSDFRSRYINGYKFPNLPKFRQDTPSWESFVLSWCAALSQELAKRASRSYLMKSILKVAESADFELADSAPEKIRDWLRCSWPKTILMDGTKVLIGDTISQYFN